ncbi:MAG: HIT family protein [archaeon]
MDASQDCAHCAGGMGLTKPLYSDDDFLIVCDVHPLTEGHILIIPKEHIACMGALDDQQFEQYTKVYEKICRFIKEEYGSFGAFEHGITGQTVFHAHTHVLPFAHNIDEVIPEKEKRIEIQDLKTVREEYWTEGKYLFLELDDKRWSVDPEIGFPRFFRDRFAQALGVPERGDWKNASDDDALMRAFSHDTSALKQRWNQVFLMIMDQ